MSVQIVGNKNLPFLQESVTGKLITRETWPYVGSGGAYRIATTSGSLTGLAANSNVFSFRWTSSSLFCAITEITCKHAVITGPTAAQEVGSVIYLARSFSVSDSGGTAVASTTGKKRASYPNFAVGDIRYSSTTALTAGTRTLDGVPLADERNWQLAAAATVQNRVVKTTWKIDNYNIHPIILTQNEGFVVQIPIAQGAALVARSIVEVEWFELSVVE